MFRCFRYAVFPALVRGRVLFRISFWCTPFLAKSLTQMFGQAPELRQWLDQAAQLRLASSSPRADTTG
jgi:hypothetical protein